MSLGEKLCNARLAKKETTSQVAAATRMKVQIVEDLEKEDFRRLAAPIYAKGFIKLYAEHVGLDAKPLIDEYMARHHGAGSGSLQGEGAPRVSKILSKQATDQESDQDIDSSEQDLFDFVPETSESQRPLSSSLSDSAIPKRAPRERQSGIDVTTIATSIIEHLREVPRKLMEAFQSARQNGTAENGPKGLNWTPLAIGAAVLVVLALVAVSVQQCTPVAGDEEAVAVPVEPEELRVAVDPPPPYFD